MCFLKRGDFSYRWGWGLHILMPIAPTQQPACLGGNAVWEGGPALPQGPRSRAIGSSALPDPATAETLPAMRPHGHLDDDHQPMPGAANSQSN